MRAVNSISDKSALRIVASVFGVLAGLGGLRHGVGEILQGNVSPGSLVIDSWIEGPIATNMDGEPAMTIIPNLMVTGVVTVIASIAVIVWAAWYIERKDGGRNLVFLSIVMLLVGGGFGPPMIGILAGLAATRIRSSLSWWHRHLTANTRTLLARLWPWVFGIAVLNGLFLMVGSLIMVYLFDYNNSEVFLTSFYFVLLSLLLSALTGAAYDIQHSKPETETSNQRPLSTIT